MATIVAICLWLLTLAIVVQRQRVLDRRLARLEHRRPRSAPPARRHHLVMLPEPGHRPPTLPSVPTVQLLARLARPLQRASG